MNNETKIIETIDLLEKRLNLNCIATELQTRKFDEVQFAHTIFKANDEHKFVYILLVSHDTNTKALVSDKYSNNEIVDKVSIKGNRICIEDRDSIHELAI